MAYQPIAPEQLRWQVDEAQLPANSSRELAESDPPVHPQQAAREALTNALQSDSTDGRDHLFVRGTPGIGRRALIEEVIDTVQPAAGHPVDFCFVHNFSQPDRPRLIRLPGGQGKAFQLRVQEFAQFVQDRLPSALNATPIQNRIQALYERADRELRQITRPLEQKLKRDGLMLVRDEVGVSARISIHARHMDKAFSAEEMANLVIKRQISQQELEEFEALCKRHQEELERTAVEVKATWKRARRIMDQVLRDEARRLLEDVFQPLLDEFPTSGVNQFISEVISDVAEKRVDHDTQHLADPALLYGANLINSHPDPDRAPLIHEHQPTPTNLLGTVDPAWLGSGRVVSSYRGIRGGSLIQAHGGFLVLDAREILSEPDAWRLLMRVLRNGQVEIAPPELRWPYSAHSLKPEAIPVKVRVILIGDREVWTQLDRADPDFSRQFRLLVELEESVARNRDSIRLYCHQVARAVDRSKLLDFDRSGMAAMIEQAARRAGQPGQLSVNVEELEDLARDSSLIAGRNRDDMVRRSHVQAALSLMADRHNSRLKQQAEAVRDGLVHLPLRGRVRGQLTGLASVRHGRFYQGCPLRINATVAPHPTWSLELQAPGRLGEASGDDPAATIRGLMLHLLNLDVPLAMQVTVSSSTPVSLAASLDELESLAPAAVCAIVSQLADMPLKQELALVGKVDLHGRLLRAAAVNEKIEFLYELCHAQGLTGNQGIIIPRPNQGDLMLNSEVVRACANDSFHVQAADSIYQVLELLTGISAGTFTDGNYSTDSLLYRAREKALEWWRSVSGPTGPAG